MTDQTKLCIKDSSAEVKKVFYDFSENAYKAEEFLENLCDSIARMFERPCNCANDPSKAHSFSLSNDIKLRELVKDAVNIGKAASTIPRLATVPPSVPRPLVVSEPLLTAVEFALRKSRQAVKSSKNNNKMCACCQKSFCENVVEGNNVTPSTSGTSTNAEPEFKKPQPKKLTRKGGRPISKSISLKLAEKECYHCDYSDDLRGRIFFCEWIKHANAQISAYNKIMKNRAMLYKYFRTLQHECKMKCRGWGMTLLNPRNLNYPNHMNELILDSFVESVQPAVVNVSVTSPPILSMTSPIISKEMSLTQLPKATEGGGGSKFVGLGGEITITTRSGGVDELVQMIVAFYNKGQAEFCKNCTNICLCKLPKQPSISIQAEIKKMLNEMFTMTKKSKV